MAFIAPIRGLTAIVSIESPFEVSSSTLTGSYQITCRDSSQVEFVSREINFDQTADMVNLYLQLDVPFFQFKILVRETHAYDYKQNGVSLAIVFLDLKQDVPQCEISSGVEDPIMGSEPISFRSDTL